MPGPVIKLQKLTKMYGHSRGVLDINLEVEPGMVFGFLGPNGAGKTTTINILLDFIRPTSGSAEIFGMDAHDNSLRIRRRVGFLAGDMALDKGLTGWQQLEYLGRLRSNFDKSYIDELAGRFNCKLDRKFKTLSRGNRQKVALIAALMHKPELLILDEPTSGLDPLMQAEFNKIILERKKSGKTTFISSHMLSEIQEICDTVAFIGNGQIIVVKPLATIIKMVPKRLFVSTKSKDLLSKLRNFPSLVLEDNKDNAIYGNFSGDINKLLRLLAGYTVEGFSLSDGDLESIFMKYYDYRKPDDSNV